MFIWPILFVKINIIRPFICSAQSFRVLCAQAGIAVRLRSRHRSVRKLNLIKAVVLLSKKINNFHVAHTQKTKWSATTHLLRKQLRLGQARIVAIFLFSKCSAGCCRTTAQQFFVISHFEFVLAQLIARTLCDKRHTSETRTIGYESDSDTLKLLGNPVGPLRQPLRSGGQSSSFSKSDRIHANACRSTAAPKARWVLHAGATI